MAYKEVAVGLQQEERLVEVLSYVDLDKLIVKDLSLLLHYLSLREALMILFNSLPSIPSGFATYLITLRTLRALKI